MVFGAFPWLVFTQGSGNWSCFQQEHHTEHHTEVLFNY